MAIYGGARPPCPVVPPCDTFGPQRVTGRVGVRAVVTLLGAIYREKSAVVTTAQRHNTFTKFSEMYKKAKNSPLLHLTIFIGIPLCRCARPDEDAENTPHMWEGQSADSHNNLLDFPTASAEKKGGRGVVTRNARDGGYDEWAVDDADYCGRGGAGAGRGDVAYRRVVSSGRCGRRG